MFVEHVYICITNPSKDFVQIVVPNTPFWFIVIVKDFNFTDGRYLNRFHKYMKLRQENSVSGMSAVNKELAVTICKKKVYKVSRSIRRKYLSIEVVKSENDETLNKLCIHTLDTL